MRRGNETDQARQTVQFWRGSILTNRPHMLGVKVDGPCRRFIIPGRTEIGPVEVRSGKIGLAEIGLSQVCVAKVRSRKISLAEIGLSEVCLAKVYPAEVRLA